MYDTNVKKSILQKLVLNSKKTNVYKKKIYTPEIRDNLYNTTKRFLKVIFSNRKVLKNIFFKNFLKQKKITKFIKNFSIKNNYFNNTLNQYIFVVLLRSHFFFFINDVNFFLNSNCITVNGLVVSNKFFKIKVGDCVAIVNSEKYFFYVGRIFKYFKKKISKFKFKRWKNFQKKKSGQFFKTWIPQFLNKFIFFKTDIPKYIEVDFFSLSIIVLYNNKNILDNDIFFTKTFNSYMLKTYNWRIS